jgi:diacylglycerol kinase (ATP)
MRAAVIFGLGCFPKNLKPFQNDKTADKTIDWHIGMPSAADSVDVILLFGGDGTIHRHLSQLVRLAAPVLVVPAGSGNDFARALGLRRLHDSIAAWRRFCVAHDNVRTIDLGLITPLESAGQAPSTIAQGRSAPHESARAAVHGARYFCCAAGVGLDGEVARRANQLPRWLRAHGGYVLSLAPAIFRFAPLPMKVLTPKTATDGQTPEAIDSNWTIRSDQPTILAAFANTSTYGGGMKIAPHAKMDDGLLDVCIVSGIDPFKLFCMFPTVYAGGHLGIRGVEYFQASRLRVETDHPLDVYADGEYVCRTPIEVAVRRDVLRVIVHPSQTSF